MKTYQDLETLGTNERDRAMKSTISCPYPTVCEYDAFRKTGKHFCERVVCPYAFSIARLMEWREAYLREAGKRVVCDEEAEA